MNLKALQELLAMAELVRQLVGVIESTVKQITAGDDVTAEQLADMQINRRDALERLQKLAE